MYGNYLGRVTKKLSSEFPTRSDTNLAVQPQKMVRGLKFRNQEVDGLYYLCGENKGADQLYCYCAADLYHSFCGMHKAGFLLTWLIFNNKKCQLRRKMSGDITRKQISTYIRGSQVIFLDIPFSPYKLINEYNKKLKKCS